MSLDDLGYVGVTQHELRRTSIVWVSHSTSLDGRRLCGVQIARAKTAVGDLLLAGDLLSGDLIYGDLFSRDYFL